MEVQSIYILGSRILHKEGRHNFYQWNHDRGCTDIMIMLYEGDKYHTDCQELTGDLHRRIAEIYY